MALDTKKWLNLPSVDKRAVPPVGVFRVLGYSFLKQGFAPDIRFFPEEEFLKYAERMGWSQEKLDRLVRKGKLVPAMADVHMSPGIYIKSGFMFAESAKREYSGMLRQVAEAYDFSEVD